MSATNESMDSIEWDAQVAGLPDSLIVSRDTIEAAAMAAASRWLNKSPDLRRQRPASLILILTECGPRWLMPPHVLQVDLNWSGDTPTPTSARLLEETQGQTSPAIDPSPPEIRPASPEETEQRHALQAEAAKVLSNLLICRIVGLDESDGWKRAVSVHNKLADRTGPANRINVKIATPEGDEA